MFYRPHLFAFGQMFPVYGGYSWRLRPLKTFVLTEVSIYPRIDSYPLHAAVVLLLALLVYVSYPLIIKKLSFRSIMAEDTPATFAFKQLGDLTLYIDVYPPTKTKADLSGPVPAVIFFRGGMAAGDRTSWLPKWLISLPSCSLSLASLLIAVPFPGRTTSAGLAFISTDYHLLPPSTGHDVLQDIVDLFAFLARTPKIGTTLIDPTRLAVAGSSAGGMCAFLAAIHVNPRPCAVLSIYGLGGDVFVSDLRF
jgi:hypothetical protein